MLQTRLWMGAILILLTVGMLVVDQHLAPWYPFLFVFVVGLSLAACHETVNLLGRERTLHTTSLFGGLLALALANWLAHAPWVGGESPWSVIAGVFASIVLAVFLAEMAALRSPRD